jgi:hypothetical protein
MRTVGKPSAVLLVAALAVTLAPKAMLTTYGREDDTARLADDLGQLLVAQGFAVTRREEIGRPPTFYASRVGCNVMIRQATDPNGYDRKYRQNAKAIGPVHYRIGSERFDEPPMLRMWIGDILHEAGIRIGLSGARAPALAVALSAACPPDALPTGNLRIYPDSIA